MIKQGIASGDRLLLQKPQYEVSVYSYNNTPLPLTMDINSYGTIFNREVTNEGIKYVVINNNTTYAIIATDTTNTVSILSDRNIKWIDTKLSDTVFSRAINKDILYISNGEIIVKSKELNMKPIKPVKTDSKISNNTNIMTLDIETVNVEGTIRPYCICVYSNKFKFGSYAESLSLNHINKMFNDAIKGIIQAKPIKYVYAHNLSGFDGILLLKHLIAFENATVEPIIHNGKIISIKFIHSEWVGEGVNRKEVVRTITFKDSFLLLPMSLRKLCFSFSVSVVKGLFPVLFNNNINYIGEIPAMKYWPDITHDEWDALYLQYGDSWSFKDEAIKYCMLDCISLYNVLTKFNELVFKEFSINVHSSLTLPALAMRIYKSSFMPKDTLYQLHGLPDRDIRESYTGGAVDM